MHVFHPLYSHLCISAGLSAPATQAVTFGLPQMLQGHRQSSSAAQLHHLSFGLPVGVTELAAPDPDLGDRWGSRGIPPMGYPVQRFFYRKCPKFHAKTPFCCAVDVSLRPRQWLQQSPHIDGKSPIDPPVKIARSIGKSSKPTMILHCHVLIAGGQS